MKSAVDLQPSEAALALLRHFEQGPHGGFAPSIYRDWAGHKTIGWGHAVQPGESFQQPISAAEADRLLLRDVGQCAGRIQDLVSAPLTQSMFDALCSFVFNVGAGAFADSRLLRLLNDSEYAAAADQFLVWDKGTNPKTGKKEELAGLSRRRRAERDLFLKEGIQEWT